MSGWRGMGGLLEQGVFRFGSVVPKCVLGQESHGMLRKKSVWWLIRQTQSLLSVVSRFELCGLLVSGRK